MTRSAAVLFVLLLFLFLRAAIAMADDQGTVTVGGRVFAAEELSTVDKNGEGQPWRGQLVLQSARLQVEYLRKKTLRAVAEAELSGKRPKVKDAFVRVHLGGGVYLRAGQFKLPFSAIEMESAWDLPVARRGLLHDLWTDGLAIAGRRPGAQVEWAGGGVKARAGVWQGLGSDDAPVAGTWDDAFLHTLAARVVAKLARGIEIGVSGQERAAQPSTIEPAGHAWAAGADAALAFSFADMRLRLWAELAMGSSFIVHQAITDRDRARFVSSRSIAAWRVGGQAAGRAYLEPFVLVGILDPDAQVVGDTITEVAAGVNAGLWKVWRAQVELELQRMSELDVPAGLVKAPADGLAVVVQLAAAF